MKSLLARIACLMAVAICMLLSAAPLAVRGDDACELQCATDACVCAGILSPDPLDCVDEASAECAQQFATCREACPEDAAADSEVTGTGDASASVIFKLQVQQSGYDSFGDINVRRHFGNREVNKYVGQALGASTFTVTMGVPFAEVADSTFYLYVGGDSARCGGNVKGFQILPEDVTYGQSTWCEVLFRATQSFWRCKTKNTYRMILSLSSLTSGFGSIERKVVPTDPFPNECR